MYYQLQKSVCMQSSDTVGRTDNMDYRHGTEKWGIREHLDPHCQKVRGSGPRTPTGSPPPTISLQRTDNPRSLQYRVDIFQHIQVDNSG